MNTINKNEDLFADFFQVGGYSNAVGIVDIMGQKEYEASNDMTQEPKVDDSQDNELSNGINNNVNTILAKDDAKEGKTFLYIGIIALALAVGGYFYFSKK